MPFYEFYCPANHRIYTFHARSLSMAGKVPRCPDHPSWTMQKRFSRFAVTGKAKEPGEGMPGPDAGDTKMEKLMAEMEREMAGMDENHPDPKQLARLMRRMSEATGEGVPANMEEMLRRMEAGEDPEKLEEEFGEVMGEMDGPDAGGGAGETTPGTVSRARRALPPSRDTRVFDMNDWLGD